MGNTYKDGRFNVIDDLFGLKLKNDETVIRWDGLRVPKWANESRHPSDLFRVSSKDMKPLYETRPESPDKFLLIPAEYAIVGKMIVGLAIVGESSPEL